MIVVVLGGARSGKSELAERRIAALAGPDPVTYVATARPDSGSAVGRPTGGSGSAAIAAVDVGPGGSGSAAIATESGGLDGEGFVAGGAVSGGPGGIGSTVTTPVGGGPGGEGLVVGAAVDGRSGGMGFADGAADGGRAGDRGPVVGAAESDGSGDPAWNERIARHRDRRPPHWATVDAGNDLAAQLLEIGGPVLLDSLGPWVAARMEGESDAAALAVALVRRAGDTVVVSDEVGLSVHPPTAAGRRFVDALGTVNRAVAEVADEAWLVVAGRVVALEPEPVWPVDGPR